MLLTPIKFIVEEEDLREAKESPRRRQIKSKSKEESPVHFTFEAQARR